MGCSGFLMLSALCQGASIADPCHWQIGDGADSQGNIENDEFVGTADDRNQCFYMVKKKSPNANGATLWRHQGKEYGDCWAEYDWTYADDTCEWCRDFVTCRI